MIDNHCQIRRFILKSVDHVPAYFDSPIRGRFARGLRVFEPNYDARGDVWGVRAVGYEYERVENSRHA